MHASIRHNDSFVGPEVRNMGSSPGDVSEEPVTYKKGNKGLIILFM